MPPSEQDLREHYGLPAIPGKDADLAFWGLMRRALLMMADAIKGRYL